MTQLSELQTQAAKLWWLMQGDPQPNRKTQYMRSAHGSLRPTLERRVVTN